MGSGYHTQVDRGGDEGDSPCTTHFCDPTVSLLPLCFITVITADETLRKCKLGKSIDHIAGAWFKTIKESWNVLIPPVIREMSVGDDVSTFTEEDWDKYSESPSKKYYQCSLVSIIVCNVEWWSNSISAVAQLSLVLVLLPGRTLNLVLMYLTSEYNSLLIQRVLAEYMDMHGPVRPNSILGDRSTRHLTSIRVVQNLYTIIDIQTLLVTFGSSTSLCPGTTTGVHGAGECAETRFSRSEHRCNCSSAGGRWFLQTSSQ